MFLYQNPKAFFIEVGKSVLKSIWTLRELKIFKTILKKKNKGGEFTLSNFKTYYKYKWIKIVCHWHVCVCVWSRSVVSDSSQPHGLYPHRLLHPWDFPGQSTGVGCHILLQRISPTQGSNPGLPHCRQTLYRLSHQERHCGTGINTDIYSNGIEQSAQNKSSHIWSNNFWQGSQDHSMGKVFFKKMLVKLDS